MKFTNRIYPKRKTIRFFDGNTVVEEREVEIVDAGIGGTELNAENLNKGNWRDDTTLTFEKIKSIAHPLRDVNEANKTMIYTLSDNETYISTPGADIKKIGQSIKGDKGDKGETGARAWIRYNTLPFDTGSTTHWETGRNYIGIQTSSMTSSPETGYVWSLFIPDGQKINFLYSCNGINDNEILSQISKDFFNAPITKENPDTASMKIIIHGAVGETDFPPYGNFASSTNPASFWDLGISNYTGKRELTFDFSNAILKNIYCTGAVYLPMATAYGARIKVNTNKVVLEKCSFTFELTGIAFVSGNVYGANAAGAQAYGFYGDGCYMDCTAIVTGAGNVSGTGMGIGHAYGFYGDGYYDNCTGICSGEIRGSGYGYVDSFGFCGSGTYKNCTGIGNGTAPGGIQCGGFKTNGSVKWIDCTGYGLTPTGSMAYCFHNTSTSSTTAIYMTGCTAALGNRDGYNEMPEDVIGINLGTSPNINVYCKGNFIHRGFDNKIIAPAEVAGKCYVGENITTIAITKEV